MTSSELRIVLEVDSGASSPEEATVKWFEAGHSCMLRHDLPFSTNRWPTTALQTTKIFTLKQKKDGSRRKNARGRKQKGGDKQKNARSRKQKGDSRKQKGDGRKQKGDSRKQKVGDKRKNAINRPLSQSSYRTTMTFSPASYESRHRLA
ncbi:hypothetical protein PENVUL_c106G05524 [Penicillium vulpinum]|uniref:Uncharacterized protein n=1 Tax=Penicillium vulpinum TaxID=29845 RepID=A0A1V6R3I9_9EURO|nr:hypothetical protein PENVUL_c106G05524 [Penicillium vulpinum]